MISRRSLLGFIAASPVIIKASSLMPVRSFVADSIRSLAADLNLDPVEFGAFVNSRLLKVEGMPVVYDAIDDWYYPS